MSLAKLWNTFLPFDSCCGGNLLGQGPSCCLRNCDINSSSRREVDRPLTALIAAFNICDNEATATNRAKRTTKRIKHQTKSNKNERGKQQQVEEEEEKKEEEEEEGEEEEAETE